MCTQWYDEASPVLGLNTESGRGVTANMPVLGTGDSEFESRRPDSVFNEMSGRHLRFYDK